MATQTYTDGVTLSSATEWNQWDTASYPVLTSVAGTNTITATGPANYSLSSTMPPLILVPANTNTGATTLAITPSGKSVLTAKNVFSGGAACVGGELVAGNAYPIQYDGTQYNIIGSIIKSGAVDLSTGSLTGVKFDATQNGSADANTLDDYEEGTWTPNVGGSATYTTQTGRYTKIGRLVHVDFILVINAIGTGSTTTISGLPFTAAASPDSNGSVGLYSGLAANVISIVPQIGASSNVITFMTSAASGTACEINKAVIGNGTTIRASGSYQST